MKSRFYILGLAVAAGFLAGVARAAEYVMAANETLTVTDATKSNYADGIDMKGANCTLVLNLSDQPTFNIRTSWDNRTAKIQKINVANWTITKAQSGFRGNYEIKAGVVTVKVTEALGYRWGDTGSVYVRSGATVVMAGNYYHNWRAFHIAGTGVDGRGAIEYTTNIGSNVMPLIVLEDDATIKATGCYYLFANYLTLNGHTLTYDALGGTLYNYGALGKGKLTVVGSVYANRGPGASVVSDSTGTITLQGTSAKRSEFIFTHNFNPSATNNVPARPIAVSGNGMIAVHLSYLPTSVFDMSSFTFTGPVSLTDSSSQLQLSVHGDPNSSNPYKTINQMSFTGAITGAGSLFVRPYMYTHTGRVYLGNSANTFSGGLKFDTSWSGGSPGTILAAYPGSLGSSYAKISVGRNTSSSYVGGAIDCELATDGSKWTLPKFANLVNQAKWNDNYSMPRLWSRRCSTIPVLAATSAEKMTNRWGVIGDVAFSYTTASGADDLHHWFGRLHLRSITPLTLDNLKLGDTSEIVRTDDTGKFIDSALILDGGTTVEIGHDPLYLVNCASAFPTNWPHLVVSNASIVSTIATPSTYYDVWHAALAVGADSGWCQGILEVQDGALVSNKLVVGCGQRDKSYPAGRGSVWQTGGKVVSLGSSDGPGHYDAGIGMGQYAFGTYELHGGEFVADGTFSIGVGNMATWTQFGGTAEFRKRNGKGEHVIGNGNGCNATVTVLGGSMTFAGSVQASRTWQSIGGQGNFITVDGPNSSMSVNGSLEYNNYQDGPAGVLSVRNGAVLSVTSIGQPCRAQSSFTVKRKRLDVCFDGGTLRAMGSDRNLFTAAGKSAGAPDSVTIGPGGMTIDTNGEENNRITTPLVAPSGKGVTSVNYSEASVYKTYYDNLKHLVGAPYVYVTNATGHGASAAAIWDIKTGRVTNVVVTSAGFGYTGETKCVMTVPTGAITLTCNLGDNGGAGPFTKTGAGDLTLSATNTWGSSLTVSGGTLVMGCEKAIPDDRDLYLRGGGTLDLNHHAVTIKSVTLGAGGGRIVNAENATLPSKYCGVISFDEIVAGNPIVVWGDTSLAKIPITITGDAPELDPKVCKRYKVLSVRDGVCTGAPSISSASLPKPWSYTSGSSGVSISVPVGLFIIAR